MSHSSRSLSDHLRTTIRPFPFSCLILAKVAPCGRCRVRIKLEDQVVWRLTIAVGAYNQRNMNYLPLGSLWQLLCKDRGCFRPSIGRLMLGPKKLGQLEMSKAILDHRLGFPRFRQKAWWWLPSDVASLDIRVSGGPAEETLAKS